MALFAPEITLYMAVMQYLAARSLSIELQRRQAEAAEDSVDKSVRWSPYFSRVPVPSNSADSLQFDFDLKYAFFVIMGGVGFPRSQLDNNLSEGYMDTKWHDAIFPPKGSGLSSFRLNSDGILDLARFGHWVYIKPESIRDRSKADGIQKSLIVLQVSWMLASCISRKAYGLPLTLLELHTMIHVVRAFVMFLFWFKVRLPACCSVRIC
jgi:hypothetical protein